MSIFEVSGLTKHYPAFTLDGVSFALGEGTVTGFIGRNGAGKTTTIRSMLNLVHPDGGTVTCFGKDFFRHEAACKQQIGFSTGAAVYYPKKKLKDIVAVAKTFYETWDEDAYARYLEMFSLDETKAPCELSEGMKVKCNLLLALSHRARLIILDEPTSGLDPFSRDELTDLFLKLKQDGTSFFFSTHITSDLEKCADRILCIREGRIILDASKQDVASRLALPGETLEQTVLRLEKEAKSC